jgi:hypothetical protein
VIDGAYISIYSHVTNAAHATRSPISFVDALPTGDPTDARMSFSNLLIQIFSELCRLGLEPVVIQVTQSDWSTT